MVDKQELREKYSKFSTEKLLELIDNKHEYTEAAVVVALEEMSKRKISEEEIKSYKDEQIQEIEKYIVRNIVDDLSFFQKCFFFFLWIPFIPFAFKVNFREDGYVLKLNQANYYQLTGFISFMLTGLITGILDLFTFQSILLWVAFFFVVFIYDEKFNRERLIKRLQKKFESMP